MTEDPLTIIIWVGMACSKKELYSENLITIVFRSFFGYHNFSSFSWYFKPTFQSNIRKTFCQKNNNLLDKLPI